MLKQPLIEECGKRIRQLRTERNPSQEELSFPNGFHRTYRNGRKRRTHYIKVRIRLR